MKLRVRVFLTASILYVVMNCAHSFEWMIPQEEAHSDQSYSGFSCIFTSCGR